MSEEAFGGASGAWGEHQWPGLAIQGEGSLGGSAELAGEKMSKGYGPTVHAQGIHGKLAKSELHNFAWSALLPPPKGSNFKTACGERISFFLVPLRNA